MKTILTFILLAFIFSLLNDIYYTMNTTKGLYLDQLQRFDQEVKEQNVILEDELLTDESLSFTYQKATIEGFVQDPMARIVLFRK